MFGWHAKRKRWNLVREAFVVQISVDLLGMDPRIYVPQNSLLQHGVETVDSFV